MWEQTEQIFLQSLVRVLHEFARMAPGLVAMALIVAIAVALAIVLKALVRRVLERLGVDERLRRWGVASPAAEGPAAPSRLAANVVAWTVLAVGFLAGVIAVDAAFTSAVAMRALDFLPSVLVAMVIVAAGVAGSRITERSVLIGAVNMGFHSARLLGLAARWIVVVVAVALALEHLGVGRRVLPVAFAILFGGIALALALAVGLGAKDAVARSLSRRLPARPRRVDEEEDEEDRIQHL
jgi:hypothetical protein